MFFKKIAGPMKVACGPGGSSVEYPLPARSGGSLCKTVQFMVKVLELHGDDPRMGLKLRHGPDDSTLTTLLATAPVEPNEDGLLVFDNGVAVVGEYVQAVLLVEGSATGDGAQVEVFETRKPF